MFKVICNLLERDIFLYYWADNDENTQVRV